MRRRVLLHDDERATAASVGTALLVVIVAAMMTVIGVFLFGIVEMPEDPPGVEVVYSQLNDRWSAHVSDVSYEADLSDYRLMAKDEFGNYVVYDDDQDGTADAIMVNTLDELASDSANGAQTHPIVYLDVDGDGAVSSGDVLVVNAVFTPGGWLFMDGTRGNKRVGTSPHSIPMDSDLIIVMNGNTLPTSDINPGDEIDVVVKHGSTVEATRNGHASASGDMVSTVHLDPAWHRGNHKVDFTVRPGEVDEWSDMYMFHSEDPDPPTAEEAEAYSQLRYPLSTGNIVSLVHVPTNTVVLEFRL